VAVVPRLRFLYALAASMGEDDPMNEELERAIAGEQERLRKLLISVREGNVALRSLPAQETIASLLTQIRKAIDEIEVAVEKHLSPKP